MLRRIKCALQFCLILTLMLSGGAASALPQVDYPYPHSDLTPVAIEILCLPQSGFGGCGNLPSVPNTVGGNPFDFIAGYKAHTDNVDFHIETTGNIFLLGPLNVTDSISFRAANILMEGPLGSEADRTNFEIDQSVILRSQVPFDIELPPISTFPEICACASTSGSLRIESENIVFAAAFTTNDGGLNPLVSRIMGTGDIYIDLSMVTLKNLKVKAGKSIVISDLVGIPVIPEPSTAVLLSLGLATLGSRRRTPARA